MVLAQAGGWDEDRKGNCIKTPRKEPLYGIVSFLFSEQMPNTVTLQREDYFGLGLPDFSWW